MNIGSPDRKVTMNSLAKNGVMIISSGKILKYKIEYLILFFALVGIFGDLITTHIMTKYEYGFEINPVLSWAENPAIPLLIPSFVLAYLTFVWIGGEGDPTTRSFLFTVVLIIGFLMKWYVSINNIFVAAGPPSFLEVFFPLAVRG